MKKDNVDKLLEVLIKSFQKDGIEAFASACCGRLYIGLDKPASCSSCSKIPVVTTITADLNADNLQILADNVKAECKQ